MTASASVAPERLQAGAQRRAHARLPALVLDQGHVAELGLRPHLGRRGAEHDNDRSAATIADRGDGPFHEQAALMADQRLRSAVPASSAGGQHQTCDAQLGLRSLGDCTDQSHLPAVRVAEGPAQPRPSRGSSARGSVGACSTTTARTAAPGTPRACRGRVPAPAAARPRGAIPCRWPWCCFRCPYDDGRTGRRRGSPRHRAVSR